MDGDDFLYDLIGQERSFGLEHFWKEGFRSRIHVIEIAKNYKKLTASKYVPVAEDELNKSRQILCFSNMMDIYTSYISDGSNAELINHGVINDAFRGQEAL